MDDIGNASMFMLLFAMALILYGAWMARSGDVRLMPYRVRHSVSGEDDVRRAGRIVTAVGLVLGLVMLVLRAALR